MIFLLVLFVGLAFGMFVEWRIGKLAAGGTKQIEQRGSL